MKRFSELQGVEICGETAFEVLSDRLPQKLVWPGYGFYIEVPAGAPSSWSDCQCGCQSKLERAV